MCLPVCPVYRETLIETDSPRARLALIRSIETGALNEKRGYIHKIYDCTTCMACSHTCPSGVHPDELISVARTMVCKKPFPLQKIITNNLISYPGRLRNLMVPVNIYQKTGIRRLVKSTGVLDLLPERLSRFDSMLPKTIGAPIYRGEKITFVAEKEAKDCVAYFPGCAQNLVFTSVARSTIEVLLKNDRRVFIPEGVVCCGMPHAGYGELEEAKRLARKNIDAYEASTDEFIITDCATCGSTLKNYDSLLADDPVYAPRARMFSKKVRDITEFLLKDISLNHNFRKLNVKATYHEPCHLGRGQGIKEAPRKLLREILGVNFIEMNEADSCCGGAGSYTLTHRQLSMKILDRKMRNLKDSGAEVIITACPGCEIQLAQGLKRSKQKVKLMHLVELLAEAYRG